MKKEENMIINEERHRELLERRRENPFDIDLYLQIVYPGYKPSEEDDASKRIAKIVWKIAPSFSCGVIKEETWTFSLKEISFKRVIKENHVMYGLTLGEEKWKKEFDRFVFELSFLELSRVADVVMRHKQRGAILDGPTQSLIVTYEDGSKTRLPSRCAELLPDWFVRKLVAPYLPKVMKEAIFGEECEDGYMPYDV